MHLVGGSDPRLRAEVLDHLVAELLEGADRSLALEELTVPEARAADGDGEAEGDARMGVVAAACEAALSPPFLTDRRIVVLRDIGNLSRKEQVEPLLAYLEAPLDSTALVLVEGGGTVPRSLSDALKKAKVPMTTPESEKTADVVAEHLKATKLQFTADARRIVTEHLGEDAGRVPALLDVLLAAYGQGATLDAAEVEPYLGAAGSVPLYELANAIDGGDVATALDVLQRLLTVPSRRDGKPMHPLQVMGVLHNHYRRLLRLDDPAIGGESEAHAALGGRGNPYGAKKTWQQSRALGHQGIVRSFDLLARADRDLKGTSGMPTALVVELLVARLAGVARAGRRGGNR